MSRMDADRLTLPLNLLDKASETIAQVVIGNNKIDEMDYRDIKYAAFLLSMATNELHRLQNQAMEERP